MSANDPTDLHRRHQSFRGVVMPTAHKSKSNLIRDVVTIGILGLLGLTVVSLYYQIYSLKAELKAELALAKGSVADERLMSLQREVSQIRQDQSSAASKLARLEDRLSAVSQPTLPLSNILMQITAVEGKLIREFLVKLNGLDPRVEAGYKVGDRIPNDKLLDFSLLLTEKLPKLKNTRYTIDEKSSIIIVSEENRVVAILSTAN
jgi:small-conductance mechanosensitive channel